MRVLLARALVRFCRVSSAMKKKEKKNLERSVLSIYGSRVRVSHVQIAKMGREL